MGCISGGTEADAGTMYPTTIEDRNGNQIFIRYNTGANANFINSSSRISEIEDTRAVSNSPGPNHTYGFTYSAPDSTGVSHLASVTNYIETGEFWNFTYYLWGISDPFTGSGKAFGNVDELIVVGNNIPLSTSFKYDASGEMLNAYLPNGGYLRYQYQQNDYSWGGIYQMAVSNRYLAQASNAAYNAAEGQSACTTQGQTGCVSELLYPISYTQATNNEPVISQTCLTDAADSTGTKAYRCWSFNWNTTYSWALGLPVGIIRQASRGAATNLTDDKIWWASEPTQGNAYLATKETITDESSQRPVYSQQVQTVDAYGNVTQTQIWDYSTSSPSGTATRTYKSYYNQPAGFLSAYIYNALDHTVLNDANGNSVTLVQNTYDTYGTGGLSTISSLSEHDSAYSTTLTTRSNVTTAVYPNNTVNTTYDITGTPTGANDGHNHAVSVSTSSSTNYSAPSTIQPNTGSSMDANLASNLTYYGSLTVNTATGANGAQSSATYDSNGRPSTSLSATGATTSYAYTFTTGSGTPMLTAPYTTTATTNTHWAKTVTDGLGRTLNATAGYNSGQTSTTVSEADTVYGPCACSPTGKMVQQSQPYTPGNTAYWTAFTYDGLGRTLTQSVPDGSKTVYSYLGNWTTVTDPAGNWKQYQKDAFGNILNVVEPNPASPPSAPNPPSLTAANTLITAYTYDFVNHLTGVTMTRTVNSNPVTQTRAFTYNSSLQLASQTSPETGTATANGTTSFTYNTDGTLATKVDPKGQTTSYTYDQYQRVSTLTAVVVTYTYTYDSDPLDSSGTFSSNEYGRVGLVRWSVTPPSASCSYSSSFSEEYAYDIPGHVTAKRLTVNKNCGSSFTLTAAFTYDNEGKLIGTSFPTTNGSALTLSSFSSVYDGMSRLVSVVGFESGTDSGCSTAYSWTQNWASATTYNAAGQLTGMQRLFNELDSCNVSPIPQYFNQAWSYNSLNQLTEIDTSGEDSYGMPQGSQSPGTAQAFFTRYHFNAGSNNGQVASVDDARVGNGGNISYQYDALKRLTLATEYSPTASTNWSQNYQYDGFGNMTWKSAPSGSAEPAYPGVNSAKNQLDGVTYDANGNTTTLNNTTYGYDGENRMSSVQIYGQSAVYAYDESNRRVENNAGAADTIYFYAPDGRLLSAFTYGSANSLWQRVYFGSMLLGQNSTNSVGSDTYVMADRLGTAVAGYPYGTDVGNTSASSDQPDFATYTKEGMTGLEYASNRYYSAGYGRFMTPDPLGSSAMAKNPGSWNRFAYAGNDPINANDPTGMLLSTGGVGFGNSFAGGGGGCDIFQQSGLPGAILGSIFDGTDPFGSSMSGMGVGPNCGTYIWMQPIFLQVSGAGGGGGGTPSPCSQGLSTARQNVGSVVRADDNWKIIEAAAQNNHIDPALLAAIGVRETGFQDISEADGAGVGVGVFQITVTRTNGVTAANANNLAWAASYAANMLHDNMTTLAQEYPNLTPDQLLQATAASYNLGVRGISGNPNTIDQGSANNNYGANILQLMKCF